MLTRATMWACEVSGHEQPGVAWLFVVLQAGFLVSGIAMAIPGAPEFFTYLFGLYFAGGVFALFYWLVRKLLGR